MRVSARTSCAGASLPQVFTLHQTTLVAVITHRPCIPACRYETQSESQSVSSSGSSVPPSIEPAWLSCSRQRKKSNRCRCFSLQFHYRSTSLCIFQSFFRDHAFFVKWILYAGDSYFMGAPILSSSQIVEEYEFWLILLSAAVQKLLLSRLRQHLVCHLYKILKAHLS